MTLDEAIKHAEEIAEENQRVVDTGIVFDDVTIDMLYCDDTEVIEEHLANYQRCAEEHRQLAEWLKELKQLREQTRWIPVSERLPKRSGEYLVSVVDGSGEDDDYEAVGVAWFAHKKDYNIEESEWRELGLDEVVIAWKPRPQPYKVKNEVEE